jgi:hypothetical protein
MSELKFKVPVKRIFFDTAGPAVEFFLRLYRENEPLDAMRMISICVPVDNPLQFQPDEQVLVTIRKLRDDKDEN